MMPSVMSSLRGKSSTVMCYITARAWYSLLYKELGKNGVHAMNRTTKRELAERLTDDRSLYFRQLLRYSTKKLWNRLADQSMTSEQRATQC
jgi:hypothetical protein